MNEELFKYLKMRLTQWAEWYSKNDSQGLGYPSYSREYQLSKTGILTSNYHFQSLPYNEEAEEIEAFVKELAEQTSDVAYVLRYHYFTAGSLRTQAEKLHMSHTKFKNFIDMGHYWLAGRIKKVHL